MQWHKIVARVILPIPSVINFALAAPVLERGIREVRVDVDVPVAAASRWDKWWTNSALADGVLDRVNTPQILESSDSDYRLEQELRPHDPRSPMDSIASPQPGLGSTDRGNSHPLPVKNDLPLDPAPPVQSGLPLDIGSPQPSQKPIDGSDSRSHSTDMPTDSISYHSVDSPTDSYHSTGSMSPWSVYEAWAILNSPSPSPSHDSNPPPQQDVPNEFYHHPHPVSSHWSDPSPWQNSPLDLELPPKSDPGPPTKPYSPSDLVLSTGAHPPDPGPPTRPSDSGQSTGPKVFGVYLTAHPLGPGPGPSEPPSPDAAGPSIPRPPPSPGPESENILSKLLFKGGRFKRRISGSRSVTAAQRELQGTLDSRDSTIKGSDNNLDAPATTAIL